MMSLCPTYTKEDMMTKTKNFLDEVFDVVTHTTTDVLSLFTAEKKNENTFGRAGMTQRKPNPVSELNLTF